MLAAFRSVFTLISITYGTVALRVRCLGGSKAFTFARRTLRGAPLPIQWLFMHSSRSTDSNYVSTLTFQYVSGQLKAALGLSPNPKEDASVYEIWCHENRYVGYTRLHQDSHLAPQGLSTRRWQHQQLIVKKNLGLSGFQTRRTRYKTLLHGSTSVFLAMVMLRILPLKHELLKPTASRYVFLKQTHGPGHLV